MKALLIVVVAITAPLVLCYDEIYDKMDVDKIIADDALFTAYTNCMLDQGPCEVEHSEAFRKPYEWGNEVSRGELVIHHTYLYHSFLELLPEVIATACAKCTPIQRQHVRKTVKALTEKKPDDFAKFKLKYDPKGEYEKSFVEFMKADD